MTATSDPTPVTEQGALVLRCRDEHARMDAARERKDVETILDCQARIGELTDDWWRLQRGRHA